MVDWTNNLRYKACFGCKKAVPVFPDDFKSGMLEKWFGIHHAMHITQIVTKAELTPKHEWEIITEKPKI